jgi:hypothetical protein
MKYLDAIFLLTTIPFIRFRYIPLANNAPTEFGFLEDDFKIDQSPDLLGRKKYALQIARGILSTKTLEKSFVIAINSPWGFGKSAFLSMIHSYLIHPLVTPVTKSEQDLFEIYKSSINNTIIVTYNPWRNLDDKKIIKDFLDELSKAFSEYHPHLSNLLHEYAKYLGKLDDSKFTKLLQTSIESLKPSDSTTALYNEINDNLEKIKKRVVIKIDDLDRLNGNELIDILKLIRNTANFKNTFFLVAYDHNYVLNTINKSNLISNKEEYLQKIVQLEVTLPTFNGNVLLEYFRSEIQKSPSLNIDYQKINSAIVELSGITVPFPQSSQERQATGKTLELTGAELVSLFSKMDNSPLLIHTVLKSIRDVVRLINSFKITYSAIGRIGDPFEILLLDIIKTKYLSIYQLLSNRQLIKIGEQQRYIFDQQAFSAYTSLPSCEVLNIRPSEVPIIEKCLNHLFSAERPPFFRSITYPQYFSLYFSYEAPNTIDIRDIEASLLNNASTFPELLKQASDQQRVDIQTYIYSLKDFSTVEQYQSAIEALMHLNKYEEKISISQIRTLLYDKPLIERLFPEKETLSSFVSRILSTNTYPIRARAEIAFQELYKIVNRNDQDPETFMIITDKKKLQDFMCSYLNESILSSGYFDEESYNLYVRTMAEIEFPSRKIRITPCANLAAKQIITDEPYRYLTKIFVRVHPEPSFEGKYFHFDPFIDYYFNNNFEEILTYLNSQIGLPDFTPQENATYQKLINRFQLEGYPRFDKFFVDNQNEISDYLTFIKHPSNQK